MTNLFANQPTTIGPLAVTLRPYQQSAVDSLYQWFENNSGNPLVVVPTGGGKSLIIAAFIHSVHAQWPKERILVLTHVRELIEQNHAQMLRAWPTAPAGIYSSGIGRREHDAPVLFAGIQSVYEKAAKVGWTDLVIVDECFVAGTMVSTPCGPVPIESIHPGDAVLNATGSGTVEAVSVTYKPTIQVELTNGTRLQCTENHPFFTARGWVQAGAMVVGEILFGEEELLALRQGVQAVEEDGRERQGPSGLQGEALEQADLLLAILREEAQEPHEQPPVEAAHEGDHPQDQAPANPQGRQWATSTSAATRASARARRRVGVGGGGADGARIGWLPESLQDRCGQQVADDGDRAGRWIARRQESNDAGHEEAGVPGVVRVARVSRAECSSPAPVFNLRVSGHPSYFAGGVLVHNCHLIPSKGMGMYRTFLDALRSMNPQLKVIGLTATPFRTDTGSLADGDDRMFHGVAYDCDLLQLIADGYLSPVTSKGTKAPIDTSSVAVRMGEFAERELEAAAMAGDVVPRAVAEIVSRGQDRKAWLLFCCGIDHANLVLEQLRAHGVSSAAVFGETKKHARDQIVADFKAGKLRAIVNVGVLTTGFDAPQTDLVVLLRPTMSPGLYVQMVGRGLRLAPGKENALVLDFGGNVLRHGPIDQVKIKQPGKKEEAGIVPARECPQCQELVGIMFRQCPACGFEWVILDGEVGSKHDDKPAEAPILGTSKGSPIERWAVNFTRYQRHDKPGKTSSLRVDYECGFQQRVSEWVCFEHPAGSFPRKKAEQWWIARGGALPVPETVDLAMVRQECGALREVATVTVDTRGDYPELRGVRLSEVEAGAVDFSEAVKDSGDVDYGDLPF